ncbi:hypothetical protein DPMN_061575 [Dreissena polymorpha]|uniref:Uncharacterized protein n=1 Tax=Dreissena polymorpha TaxID=45954 RepID=A0A9D4C842_DREPO|nr:hypothetical protein DPMN_061575 [Dreissena polymorpha]
MRRSVLWRLIWIQTVGKGLQNSVPALKGLRTQRIKGRDKIETEEMEERNGLEE